MNQLILRNNRDMKYFDEDDWTLLAWQDRRLLDSSATHGKDSNKKGIGNTDTIIGAVYLGLFIVFIIVFLT